MVAPQQRAYGACLLRIILLDDQVKLPVQQAMTVNEAVDACGNADAAFGISPSQPGFKERGIGCVHFQPYHGHSILASPVLGRLPAEIPYPHAFFAVATDTMFVFRALGAVAVNLPVIDEYARRRAEMFLASRQARADGHHAQWRQPVRGRGGQHDPHQLDPGRAVHDQHDLLILWPCVGMVQHAICQRHGAFGLFRARQGGLRPQFLLHVVLQHDRGIGQGGGMGLCGGICHEHGDQGQGA
ncbi:hypothetical protein S101446_02242 [Komagataeibacter europaeus]|nr:hypothetical protein S101446_02242 [Komagataeibacter europaeus]